MADFHKLEKDGQTVWPCTVTTAIVDPDTEVNLQDNIECWNLPVCWPSESVNALQPAVTLINSKLPASKKIPGVKIEFKNTAGKSECWEFIGGTGITFTNLAGWREAGGNAINKLMNAVFPIETTFTVTPNVIEVGKTTKVQFKWDTTKAGTSITSECTYKLDGSAVGDVISKEESLTPSKYEEVTRKLETTYLGDSKEFEVKITYIQPSYYGVVEANVTPEASNISSLTSELRATRAFTKSDISYSNQKFVYAYPAVLGDLTSIKDGNGFEYLAGGGFTKTSVTLNSVPYNVYTLTTQATVKNFKFIFA